MNKINRSITLPEDVYGFIMNYANVHKINFSYAITKMILPLMGELDDKYDHTMRKSSAVYESVLANSQDPRLEQVPENEQDWLSFPYRRQEVIGYICKPGRTWKDGTPIALAIKNKIRENTHAYVRWRTSEIHDLIQHLQPIKEETE